MAQFDQFVQSGCDWAKERGIPNHKFSAIRVGDHVHVINCMFDMANLAAIVVKGAPGYSTKVKPMSTCEVCEARSAANQNGPYAYIDRDA